MTYYYMLAVGAISWIIDTVDGEVMYGDKDETVHRDSISSYHDESLKAIKPDIFNHRS